MTVEHISEHIWTVKPWIPIRVWLVAAEDGVTLIDTGLPFMVGGILKAIDSLGAGPLRRILLTHGHSDHVGGITKLLSNRQVPVYAHRVELPYIEGALPFPRRKKPEKGLPKGLVQPLAEASDGSLEPVAGLLPIHTPGHSPGHVVYYHRQDGVMIGGDQFSSRKGQLRPPVAMFSADMAEALRSQAVIARLRPERLEITHSGPVFQPAEQLK
ncbi:MAG TPA: MBL fold metallo-hydrolase [Symbiobacteriaceae bacterium]|nr:MBL fold metallo-hydrolase [Symbiobacteriaceae bacterium]